MPLRRLLPPIGKIDTATVVAILLIAALRTEALYALQGVWIADPLGFTLITLKELVGMVLKIYLFAMLLYWIATFVSPGGYAPGDPLACTAVRADPAPRAARDPTDRSDRLLVPLGIDRDRRATDITALNMRSYVPEM